MAAGAAARGLMAGRLTGEETTDIAQRIIEAVGRMPPGEPRLDILSQLHELPHEDEDRVEAALVKLRAADYGDTWISERE